MLWKEIVELDDCEQCPIKQEGICPGGWTATAGGVPVEPVCCMFDDDTDVDLWIQDYYDRVNRIEVMQERQRREKEMKRKRAEKAAETRRQIKYYCWKEIDAVKKLKAELVKLETLMTQAQRYIDAVNTANELFKQRQAVSADYTLYVNFLSKVPERKQTLQEQLNVAEEILQQKRKEFYKQRKDLKC